jgi:hypothetical protein
MTANLPVSSQSAARQALIMVDACANGSSADRRYALAKDVVGPFIPSAAARL